MIKIFTKKLIFLSAFLISSFYLIVSNDNGRRYPVESSAKPNRNKDIQISLEFIRTNAARSKETQAKVWDSATLQTRPVVQNVYSQYSELQNFTPGINKSEEIGGRLEENIIISPMLKGSNKTVQQRNKNAKTILAKETSVESVQNVGNAIKSSSNEKFTKNTLPDLKNTLSNSPLRDESDNFLDKEDSQAYSSTAKAWSGIVKICLRSFYPKIEVNWNYGVLDPRSTSAEANDHTLVTVYQLLYYEYKSNTRSKCPFTLILGIFFLSLLVWVTHWVTAEKLLEWTSTTPRSEEALVKLRKDVILQQQIAIEREMQNCTLFNKKRHLKDLQVVKGGQPIRNIIFTTWRSGSTFLGEALTSFPGTFYHYEPLLHFDIVQVRSGKLANEALRVIRSLLQCDYSQLQEYLDYGKNHINLHEHNSRLWKNCIRYKELCYDKKFLSGMCNRFPIQVMKTVRMRLKLAEELIIDKKLDIRVLFLIRDPRGTLQSRKHRTWCPPSPDCSDPKRLCSDMVDDYHSAVKLRQKYPQKIMYFEIVRYEDISLNPYSGVKKVLKFFRLGYEPQVESFIKTHTSKNYGGVSSTFRDSKSTPFKWIKYFMNNKTELAKVQTVCKKALKLWGYAPLNVTNKNDSSNLTLLLKPPWKEMIVPEDSKN